MKVVLATEVYPPRAGGAGWSVRALGLALREAGHAVTVLTTSPGPSDLDGLDVRRLRAPGRKRLGVPRAFARAVAGFDDADVVHAQHSLSALGCLAGEDAGRVVVTVRDHWPVCFWSTRISRGALCPECGLVPMTRCIEGRVRVPAPFSLAAIPYMWADLREKHQALSRAGATLAVSEAIARELRASGLPRVEVVPNVVDPAEVRALAETPPAVPLPEKFLLFVGKLEENKGIRFLIPALKAAGARLPLVVLGEGSLAHALKLDATAAGIDVHLRGWTHREDVLRAMSRAEALVFPSLWPEPLSRVLLEALALGTPIAAMDTGGSREIFGDGESGLVASDAAGLGDALGRLLGDPALRARLREAALARAEAFSPASLIPRYLAVYRRLA
ncbi:MAG TPA: glycosyltransferase family 4 protein [Vicinamibacteria bacterium]|nr:glycosyltransferase family 4 protein [Vicinamibacteria bacterium]